LQQQQKALLMQVLQLSDAEISALPPGQQEQVRQLVSTCFEYPLPHIQHLTPLLFLHLETANPDVAVIVTHIFLFYNKTTKPNTITPIIVCI
jgi:hypothetical protein